MNMLGLLAIVGGGLAVVLALILALRPVTAGPLFLAVGICIQAVAIAVVVVPVVGPRGGYAALWKEAVVGVLLFALVVGQNRSIARRLPTSVRIVLVLTIVQLVLYMAFPVITSSSGVPPAGTTARLAGLRQWLVPCELLLLGHTLHNAGLSPGRLLAFVKRFGTVVAVVSIAGWVFIPLDFWARVNLVTTTTLSGDPAAATGQLEGLQSYFLGQAVPRAVAPFGSPLVLAFSLLLPMWLVAATRHRGPANFPLLLIGTALILTQTRSILFGIVAVWILSKLRRRMMSARLIAGLLTLTFLAAGPLSVAIDNTLTLKDPSSNVHYAAIRDGYLQLLTNPLGVGLGQGGQIGRAFGYDRAGGESLYFVAGNERGWLGLALVVGLFLVCFTAIGLHHIPVEDVNVGSDESEAEALCHGLRRAVVVLAIASVTTEHAVAFTSTWLLWVALGFGVTQVGRPVLRARVHEGARGQAPVVVRPSYKVGPRS